MKPYLLILSLFTFSACAQPRPVHKITDVIHPGEARWVQFPLNGENSRFVCRDKELKFSKNGKTGQTVVIDHGLCTTR